MATIYETYEKPSALTRDERVEYVKLWERACGAGLRLSPSELSRFRSLGARMVSK